MSFYTSVLTQAQVTDHYQLGTAPAIDGAGPTGGSVDASGLVGTGGRYSTSTTLNLVLAKGTDPSGVASSGNQLLRASASLTNGSCGTFGSYTLVTGGTDPSRPRPTRWRTRPATATGTSSVDTVGNATTYTSPDIKVDPTAPAAPTLGFSALTNTHAIGSTVHYRSAATSGSVHGDGSRDRRRVRDRQLHLPGARHRMDRHPRRARRDDVLVERRARPPRAPRT